MCVCKFMEKNKKGHQKTDDSRVVKRALRKTRATVASLQGEELKDKFNCKDTTMEGVEAIQEFGRVMAESMNRQFDEQKRREENTEERYRELLEGQMKTHREDSEILTREFGKLRIEKELARGRNTVKLPMYDGLNLDIDEWTEKVEACVTCNEWNLDRLMEQIPTSLTAMAKRAYDMITEDDKRTKEAFFASMKNQIDPQAQQRNKELFRLAKKGPGETVTTFVNRLRTYIRRSGEDPKLGFVEDILKYRVYDSLPPSDRKLLKATMDHSTDLDKIIVKAESLVSDQLEATGFIGVVREGNGQSDRQRQDRMPYREGNGAQRSGRAENTESPRMWDRYSGPFNGVCWNCQGQIQSNEGQLKQEPMYSMGTNTNGYGGPYHQPPPPMRPPFPQSPTNRENIDSVPENAHMTGPYMTASPNQVQSHATNPTDTQLSNLDTPG